MALPPYNRSFNAGHQSELLYNDKLHRHFKATEHLLDKDTPEGELDGELWLKRPGDELKTFHKSANVWSNVFGNKFQIIDQIADEEMPQSPVTGQLWIYNGVLMFFNGTSWQPVKALEQPNLQHYLVGLNDFAFISPILSDDDSKLTIPNVALNRIFIDHDLNFDYRKINSISVQYDKTFLENKNSAFVHINAGRLTKIRKRLFRFDKDNAVINMSSMNTEFYGFRDYDVEGDLLIPRLAGSETANENFDYEVMNDGVYLTDYTAQTYDYILAVTYEFEWIRSAGSMFAVKATSSNVKNNSAAKNFSVSVDDFDETMIYRNGKLLCNYTAVSSDIPQQDSNSPKFANDFKHNEIRCFIPTDKFSTTDSLNGLYYYWHAGQEKWLELDRDRISGIQTIVKAYENFSKSVKCNFNFSASDDIRVYGFKYSNSVLNPPVIKNISCQAQDTFNTEKFIPAENSLSVYVNGIRQYSVKENFDGDGFKLPAPVTGVVTYVIEKSENGYTQTAVREILDENNLVNGAINVYSTNISLYPGRVIVYVDGLRLNRDNFIVLDNHTLIVNSSQALIGNKDNFPVEKIDAKNEILHRHGDKILVEVKYDYGKIESAIKLDKFSDASVKISDYPQLQSEMLATKENIFIYLNGLFTGLILDKDYTLDFFGESVKFKNSDFVTKLSVNALQAHLNSDVEIYRDYRIFNRGLNYSPPLNEIIFEWRS